MGQRGVSLIQSDTFSFKIKDGIISIEGNLDEGESKLRDKLSNDPTFKRLAHTIRSGIKTAIIVTMYQNSVLGKQNVEIFKKFGYTCTKKTISWNEFIPIQKVIIGGVIRDIDQSGLIKLGYGIQSFSVMNLQALTNSIYCKGVHPNVDKSHKLCVGELDLGSDMSLDNLNMIRVALSVANLDLCFNKDLHMEKIIPLVW